MEDEILLEDEFSGSELEEEEIRASWLLYAACERGDEPRVMEILQSGLPP